MQTSFFEFEEGCIYSGRIKPWLKEYDAENLILKGE